MMVPVVHFDSPHQFSTEPDIVHVSAYESSAPGRLLPVAAERGIIVVQQ